MPIRVKPIHDLGPCSLDLDSLKGICTLIDKTFHYATYSATDGVWEIYDEESPTLLTAISGRAKLDSFCVTAPSMAVYGKAREMEQLGANIPTIDIHRNVQLIFDNKEAKAVFDLPPDQYEWVEHFILDLRKHIHRQLPGQWFGVGSDIIFILVRAFGVGISRDMIVGDYTRIILKPKQQSATAKSIRDNITSNLIYDVLKFVFVFALAFVAFLLYNRYGVNINEWFVPPVIPTPTP